MDFDILTLYAYLLGGGYIVKSQVDLQGCNLIRVVVAPPGQYTRPVHTVFVKGSRYYE